MTDGSGVAQPLLSVEELNTRYFTRRGLVRAVNGVSFTVGQGEIVGVMGESGCGKSATVRSVLGLIRPPGRITAGRVVFGGQDLLDLKPKALRKVRGQQIGFVTQNPFGALNQVLSVEQQFRAIMRAHSADGDVHERAGQMLAAVGLPGTERVLASYAHELSGGMAQRVVIAMALLLDPRLVIADEPTTALDVTIQRQILDLMRDLTARQGRSMLLVTHDLGVVAQYCDRVVVMYAGRVVEEGPVAQVLARPAHPYTLALLRAVPRRGGRVEALSGRVPDLADYPSGCPFHERCAFADETCAMVLPEMRQAFADEPGRRRVACHRNEEEVADLGVRAG